jgi:hypothetical protein
VTVKLPPVTCEPEMATGLMKQGFVPKVPVPLSWKLPSASEDGVWVRVAVMLITTPSGSEKLPA